MILLMILYDHKYEVWFNLILTDKYNIDNISLLNWNMFCDIENAIMFFVETYLRL